MHLSNETLVDEGTTLKTHITFAARRSQGLPPVSITVPLSLYPPRRQPYDRDDDDDDDEFLSMGKNERSHAK